MGHILILKKAIPWSRVIRSAGSGIRWHGLKSSICPYCEDLGKAGCLCELHGLTSQREQNNSIYNVASRISVASRALITVRQYVGMFYCSLEQIMFCCRREWTCSSFCKTG